MFLVFYRQWLLRSGPIQGWVANLEDCWPDLPLPFQYRCRKHLQEFFCIFHRKSSATVQEDKGSSTRCTHKASLSIKVASPSLVPSQTTNGVGGYFWLITFAFNRLSHTRDDEKADRSIHLCRMDGCPSGNTLFDKKPQKWLQPWCPTCQGSPRQ